MCQFWPARRVWDNKHGWHSSDQLILAELHKLNFIITLKSLPSNFRRNSIIYIISFWKSTGETYAQFLHLGIYFWKEVQSFLSVSSRKVTKCIQRKTCSKCSYSYSISQLNSVFVVCAESKLILKWNITEISIKSDAFKE